MTFQNIIKALENPGLHLSKKIILSQISEEKIWSVSLGFEPNEGDYITSPFRKDNSPGCKFIRNKQSGLLCLYDGASVGSVNGIRLLSVDCFQSIQILKGYSEGLVLSKIQELVNQGKVEGLDLGSTIVKKVKSKSKSKSKTLIYYWERKWNKWDKEYWNSYRITKEQLVSDGIIPIDSWGLKSEGSSDWKKFWCSHWCSYIINDDSWRDRIKGYMPYSKSLRFFGNVDNNCIGGFWDLSSEKDIIIKKSYKDWRVIKNLGLNTIWFQNEGMLPDLELFKEFKNCRFTILFDNDKAGIKAAYKIRNEMRKEGFKVRAVILNRKFLTHNKVKDPADLIKTFPHLMKKLKDELLTKTRYGILETIPEKIHGL